MGRMTTISLSAAIMLPWLAASAQPVAPLAAQELPADWRGALQRLPGEVPAPQGEVAVGAHGVQNTNVYQRGGYRWEDAAQEAMRTAEANLRAAGFAVLASQVVRRGVEYSLRVEYLAGGDPRLPPADLETYRSQPGYRWEEDAAKDMERTKANLAEQGFSVILGQVIRSGVNYLYEIDYAKPYSPWPEPGRQNRLYQRGGYRWEDDARNAMQAAEAGLRAAGYAILASQVSRQGVEHGFRVEYLAPSSDPRFRRADLETYKSQASYRWDEEAAADMERTKANLAQQGFAVILGQVLRSGARYLYEIDYLRPHAPRPWPRPGRELEQSGGPYRSQQEAQRDMVVALGLLKAQGYEIVSFGVHEDRRLRKFYFRIAYRERGR